MNWTLIKRTFVFLIPFCAIATQAYAQRDMSAVEITYEEVSPGLYMLVGQGGNIGLSVGADGVFMIDDQFAPLTEKILAAVAEITDKPVEFLLNTHHHGDHTGGNENMGKKGTHIVAHDNVRKRLNKDDLMGVATKETPGLPIVTFGHDVTLHMNGHTIEVIHVPNAHTDGDAIVKFMEANVVHMGDTFFNERFPYIDLGGGGSVDGFIAASDAVLAMTDDETKIIPGHGVLATRTDLMAFRKMVNDSRNAVATLKSNGMSEEEVVAENPLSSFPAEYGSGFMSTERYTRILFADKRSEEHAVRAVIDRLFDGMRAGDSTQVRSTFTPEATLYSNVLSPDGKAARRGGSIDNFVKAVGTPHDQVWDEKIWDVEIRVDDLMADAWVPYAFYLGSNLSHCGVNSFQFFKSEEGWKVTAITDTRSRDCKVPDHLK